MTRKKYEKDTHLDRFSDDEPSDDEEDVETGFYDEDIARENLYKFINEYGKPSWIKHYISADFLLELVLSYDIDYYQNDHLRFRWETEEDMDLLREDIFEMIEMCAFEPTYDHIQTIFCAMLTERAKFYILC